MFFRIDNPERGTLYLQEDSAGQILDFHREKWGQEIVIDFYNNLVGALRARRKKEAEWIFRGSGGEMTSEEWLNFQADRFGLRRISDVRLVYCYALEDIIKPSAQGARGAFYMHDDRKSRWVKPRNLFYESFRTVWGRNSLICPFSPDNFYFSIAGGSLFIKYQQIIGSRLVCFLPESS